MPVIYSPGITIADERSKSGQTEALKKKSKKAFQEATRKWLDEIKKTACGAELLAEIDNSKHVVTIYRTWTKDDGNCEFGEDVPKSMVVPLKGKYKNGELELARVLGRACEDISGRNKFEKFFNLGKARHRFISVDALGRLIGVSGKELKAMAAGKTAIPKHVDEKLRVYLYDFLTPGKGSDCGVRFNFERDNLSPEHKKYLPQSHNWQNRPPGVALAHELIHAWRCMVGRVLFNYGWEEEAMTVGLPPFTFMPFTENHVRVQWGGLAVRPDYQNIGIKTDMIQNTDKIGIDKAGNRSWQGNQSALHTNQGMAQQASARRKAMGYDDNDDDADDDWDT